MEEVKRINNMAFKKDDNYNLGLLPMIRLLFVPAVIVTGCNSACSGYVWCLAYLIRRLNEEGKVR
jgi:hypothetical protein